MKFINNQTAKLIVPVEDIKMQTKPMQSTVKSRKNRWIGYKRFSLKEVCKCLSMYSASL